jgi:hypothetical protein
MKGKRLYLANIRILKEIKVKIVVYDESNGEKIIILILLLFQ